MQTEHYRIDSGKEKKGRMLMKKFLSLVLTLALTMSLVVLPARAADPTVTGTYSITADKSTIMAGDTVKFTANASNVKVGGKTGTVTGYEWVIPTGYTGSDSSAKDVTVTARSASTTTAATTIKCTLTITYDTDKTVTKVVTKQFNVYQNTFDASDIDSISFNGRTYGANAVEMFGSETLEKGTWKATIRSSAVGVSYTSATYTKATNTTGTLKVKAKLKDGTSKEAEVAITGVKHTYTVTATAPATARSGEKVTLTAAYTNSGSTNAKYEWTIKKGTSTVTTSSRNSNATYEWTAPSVSTDTAYTVVCTVYEGTVKSATSEAKTVTVSKDMYAFKTATSSVTVTSEEDKTLADIYLYTGATKGSKLSEISEATVVWESSNEDVVKVAEGVVSAGTESGSAKVTATITYQNKDYTVTYSVTVKALAYDLDKVTNGSSQSYTYSTLKSAVVSAINNVYGSNTLKTSGVDSIEVTSLPDDDDEGVLYKGSVRSGNELSVGELDSSKSLAFKSVAGLIGTVKVPVTVNNEYNVILNIPVVSASEVSRTVNGSTANGDVSFTVSDAGGLYVFGGSKFDKEDYEHYWDGHSVSNWKYYDKGDKITVDKDDFSNGKCVLYVVALDKNDVASTGTITVYQKAYEIKYSGVAGETVTFEHDDFVKLMKEIAYDEGVTTSKTSTKITLDDVDFELPSSSDGVLYYNGAKMTSSTTCKDMDKVTFAIGKNVKDTVSIDFTINATDSDKDKHEFDGTVVVSVVHEDIKYTNAAGAVVTFKASDFEDFFTDEYSKGELDYVKFDKLPTTLEGVLYASYNTLYTGALAKTSDKFYYDADSKTDYEIGDVVFKGANLTATSTKVYIPFTAYGEDKNDDDVEVSGWVVITVAPQRVMNFTDVKIGEWYYNNVKSAYNMGLIDGKTATTFNPNDNMTYAEAVKLAACMHQLKKDGAVTLTNSKTGNWYDSYVDYAIKNGIIVSAPTAAKANTAVTRREYVDVFYNALPATDYVVRNSITKIPDLANDSTNAKIYTFYKAGILTGYANTPGKTTGSFGANDNIKRSEVATILIRMMDSSTRMYFTL